MSLRTASESKLKDVGIAIEKIWNRLSKVKNGISTDLHIEPKHRKKGNLTVLIAYGAKTFDIPGSKKTRPANFSQTWNFRRPNPEGGGHIVEGSDLKYSPRIYDNHLLDDNVLFQFIADNEFFTNRAAFEVWRELRQIQKNIGYSPLRISALYTGFQRADHRNWIGFHDGVSNLRSQERPYVIEINSKYLSHNDKWILNGTFMAFMRIIINFEKWDELDRTHQELIIGRDKSSGCPLVINAQGKLAKVPGCPIPGTSEVIEHGNERFREHPPYSSKILQNSHIGRTRSVDKIPVWDRRSFRIFRQGFEFLLSSPEPPYITPGLNFVSFQNTPERLYKALTFRNTLEYENTKLSTMPNFDRFTYVLSAGMFLVPPITPNEIFPGARIFDTNESKITNYR